MKLKKNVAEILSFEIIKNMSNFTIEEFNHRISKLQNHLASKNIDAAVLTQNSDIYYYSGSCEPLYLIIHSKKPAVMLARKAISRIREEVKHIELFEFYNSSDMQKIIDKLELKNSGCIGFTLDTVSYSTVDRFKKIINFSAAADISFDVRMLRVCKSESELNVQIEAGKITAQLPEVIKKVFVPGMTELELSAEIEKYFRLNGGSPVIRCRKEGIECIGVCSSGINSLSGTKFDGICSGSGISSATPYGASRDIIQKNIPVIIDFGFSLYGYIVDITRMFCYGKVSDKIINAYNSMLKIENELIKIIKPGTLWCDIYDSAFKMAVSAGYEKEFMGLDSEKVRFVGHGIGLELDEPPFLAPKMNFLLEENMVIAIEPKVSLPDIGVIGIENTYIIRNKHNQLLTCCSNDFIYIN
ncbi:aminopeptidase P family protein [Candidatus Dependentiae bacterium]|nr:aminopeptidase P family protein [Candidatus Dependentiae bacterium]